MYDLNLIKDAVESNFLDEVMCMCWFSLLMPWMLMVHNMIDFRSNGAQEEYSHILNHVMTEYVEMLEDNNSIKLVYSGGTFNEKIHGVILQFEMDARRDTAGAREVMLGLIDSLLNSLNNGFCERLTPFLCPSPFTDCNLEIQVTFVDTCKYAYPLPGSIKRVNFCGSGGMLSYFTENPRCLGELEILRDESLVLARLLGKSPPVKPCY